MIALRWSGDTIELSITECAALNAVSVALRSVESPFARIK